MKATIKITEGTVELYMPVVNGIEPHDGTQKGVETALDKAISYARSFGASNIELNNKTSFVAEIPR